MFELFGALVVFGILAAAAVVLIPLMLFAAVAKFAFKVVMLPVTIIGGLIAALLCLALAPVVIGILAVVCAVLIPIAILCAIAGAFVSICV